MYIYIYIHSLYKSVPRNSLPSGELFAMDDISNSGQQLIH